MSLSLFSKLSSLPRSAPTLWSRAAVHWSATQRLSTISVGNATSAQMPDQPAEATSEAKAPLSHHIVMSVSGPDRPGIVKSVSEAVHDHDANIEESKMAILGGDFAMIVYVSISSADDAEKLAVRIRDELKDFSISVRETSPPNAGQQQPALWSLSLQGPDHPGIVAAVSEALAKNGCNVHALETETSSAPFAGYEIFTIGGSVSVNEENLDQLSTSLNKIEEQFGATITLAKGSE